MGESDASCDSAAVDYFRYDLRAVVVHHGSAAGGHYTAFCRLDAPTKEPKKGCWVHISDEDVRPATIAQVLSCEAYMLFYAQRASAEA